VTVSEEHIEHMGLILETGGFSDDEIDDYFLEHFGTRGMRWGVRRARRAERIAKVGKGKGNILDKARVHTTANPVSVVKARGFKKAAAQKGERFERRAKNMADGKAKLFKDIIPSVGAIRYGDMLPSASKKALSADDKNRVKKMSNGKEAAFAFAAIGAGIAVSSIARQVSRRAVSG
jgi:hypothetical protein